MYSPISYVLPAALFFILSPNILLRLPKNGSKYLVALVHSIIFAILLHFLMKYLPIQEGYSINSNLPQPLIIFLIVLGCLMVVGSFMAK
jgi:energy-converting hydrogenase Eha subunit A